MKSLSVTDKAPSKKELRITDSQTKSKEPIEENDDSRNSYLRVDSSTSVVKKKKKSARSFMSLRSNSTVTMSSIQLAIHYCLSKLVNVPQRDILMDDFFRINLYVFPSSGSSADQTPAHVYPDFSFNEFSPVAFRYFRDIFGIKPEDYMTSMCGESYRELSNPGASGSLFYLTTDDVYVIKTVDQREAKFLQQLLPGYYMNLLQNSSTLLPKFFGLYHYSAIGHTVRIVTMNNLLPSSLKFHEKYDIKGSTFKRRADAKELLKSTPTLKDLDFIERHPNGIILEPAEYDLIISTLERDARVLRSFKIMDYSLLVGIHKLDVIPFGSKLIKKENEKVIEAIPEEPVTDKKANPEKRGETLSNKMRGLRLNEDVNHQFDTLGGIPATDAKGNKLLLFIGIIDILQNFRLVKQLEHKFKSVLHDGKTISVNKPSYYEKRFIDFCKKRLFRPPAGYPSSENRIPCLTVPDSGKIEKRPDVKSISLAFNNKRGQNQDLKLSQSSVESSSTIRLHVDVDMPSSSVSNLYESNEKL